MGISTTACSGNQNNTLKTNLVGAGYGVGGYGVGGYGGGVGQSGGSPQPIYKMPLSYYLGLFTSEWQKSTNLLNWASLAWQPIDSMTSFLQQFSQQNFSLQFAVGVQLDAIGTLIGQSRTVAFQPSDGVSPVLDDDTYRLLLTATIFKLKWDGKIGSLYLIWKALFSQGSIVINDNQNMSATIIINGSFTSIIQDLIMNGYIVPRPEGVQYTYVVGELPMFGTDLDNTYIAGVDKGHII